MRRGWFWAALAGVLALVLGAVLAAGPLGGTPQASPPEAGVPGPSPLEASDPATGALAHPNRFFNPTLFYGGLAAASRAEPYWQGRLAGGLVPHHDLAAELLSGFFLRLEEEPPEVIFLVGPNHEESGQRVTTGRRSWQTEFGQVEADQESISRLERAGLAVVDDDLLAAEHAMGTLMPYIKYHAPDARVVPLVIHRGMSLAQLERLADGLAAELGEGRILVASVDFSHYLTRAEAAARDEVTLETILQRDFDHLMRMGPDHVDSPGSVVVLFHAMEAIGANGPEVTGHTNSGEILKDDRIETTSYFTFVFTKP